MNNNEIGDMLAAAMSAVQVGAEGYGFDALLLKPDMTTVPVPTGRRLLTIALDVDREEETTTGPTAFPDIWRKIAATPAVVRVLASTTLPELTWRAIGRDLRDGMDVAVILTTALRVDVWAATLLIPYLRADPVVPAGASIH